MPRFGGAFLWSLLQEHQINMDGIVIGAVVALALLLTVKIEPR
jgi:hypothetical protein